MNIQEDVILVRLKKARTDMGLSGDDVAKKIGKSDNSFISRLENGKQKLNIDTINKLCKIYHLNPVTLFTGSASEKTNVDYNRKGFLNNLEYRSHSGEISESIKKEIKTILPTLRKIGKVMKRLGEAPLTLATFFLQTAELLNPASIQEAKRLGQKVAIALREHLNLGNDPIADIQNLTWHTLKIPICSLDLGNRCWGIYNRDSAGNPLVIYSSADIKQRNIFTIAHELGHHFFSLGEPSIDINTDNHTTNLKEGLADAFAQELLVPEASLNEYMKDEGLCLIELQQRHIVDLCQYFKVSYFMMLVVLHDNQLITKKQLNELKCYNQSDLENIGYTPKQYMANTMDLESLLKNLVAKGIRKERFNYLFASEILDTTEEEVKAIV